MKLAGDIEEDVTEEIDIFVRLSRLGNFQKGMEWLNGSLLSHAGYFPVLAERADFLLEQGSYKQLGELLDDVDQKLRKRLYDFTEDERLLIRLFKAHFEMHSHGNLNDALEEARSVVRRLPKFEPHLDDDLSVGFVDIFHMNPVC